MKYGDSQVAPDAIITRTPSSVPGNALREAAAGAVTAFDTLMKLHNDTGDDILIGALETAISKLREALK